jgi:hypothetical protein
MNGTGRAIVTAEGATEITVNQLPTLKLASSLKSAFPDAITAAISNQASRVLDKKNRGAVAERS